MRHTSAVLNFIEHMAQEQLKYETIFAENAEILKADQPKFDAAMVQIQQSPLVAKPGQRWQSTQETADEYLACCNDICRSVPQDFNDRVKILHGAHAALMCLVRCKFAQQPESVQLAIMKRHHELDRASHPTPPMVSNRELPLSKPSIEPRRITAEELQLFRSPDNLHGKQFILSPGTCESGMYEVIGYSRKRDKTIQYEVLFDDCADPITVNAKEMMAMLEDSLYLPA